MYERRSEVGGDGYILHTHLYIHRESDQHIHQKRAEVDLELVTWSISIRLRRSFYSW